MLLSLVLTGDYDMNAFASVAVLVALFGVATSAAASDLEGYNKLRNWTLSKDIEDKRRQLHRAYSVCSQTATLREMSISEAEMCAEVYTRLKLTFLRGSDLQRFRRLSPATRADGNEKAYAAYRAWLHRNIVMNSIDNPTTALR